MKNKNLKKFLFWFANEHPDFRMAEVESIMSLLKITVEWQEISSSDSNPLPFLIAELPNDEVAIEIANRSVTLKHITELWTLSTTSDELHDSLKQLIQEEDFINQYSALSSATFRFNVEIYCKAQSYSEKVARMEKFSYLPFRGRVDLKNPRITFQYFEFYGTNPNHVPENPYFCFFGKLIARSQRKSIHDLSLKKRKFIGNTSMDAELSLIMVNHARVAENDIVFDPFVGSGSLLVAAAYCGAYVFGVDIDYLMIHGKTKPTRKQNRHEARKDESVLANLKQYNLTDRYVDVVVGDSSLPLLRPGFILDAIVTDPPYGIREATERIGTKDSYKNNDGCCKQNPKFPKKTVYGLDHILQDLLNFAAAHLKMNGRLVTWIPVIRTDYQEENYIPQHKCFTLISNCEQVLSRIVSRRLLTFEKTHEPQSFFSSILRNELEKSLITKELRTLFTCIDDKKNWINLCGEITSPTDEDVTREGNNFSAQNLTSLVWEEYDAKLCKTGKSTFREKYFKFKYDFFKDEET